MYLLCCFRKGADTNRVLVACEKELALKRFCKSINDYVGYQSGVGIWSQENVPGYCYVEEVQVLPANQLDENFMDILYDFKERRSP